VEIKKGKCRRRVAGKETDSRGREGIWEKKKEEEAEIRKFGGKGDDQCNELDPHRQNEVDNY